MKAAALSVQRDNMFPWRYYNGMVRGFISFDWYYKRIKRNYPVLMDYKDAMYRPYENMMERVIGKNLPDFTALLMNNTYSAYWQTQDNDHVADVLEIPVLLSEGWYDFYLSGIAGKNQNPGNSIPKQIDFTNSPPNAASHQIATQWNEPAPTACGNDPDCADGVWF